MGSPLTQARVKFDDGSEDSTEIDLSGYLLRGVFSPDGHSLGKITISTVMERGSDQRAALPAELVDNDEAATLLNFERDWPLWLTTFHVEHTRDEAFEMFLLLEHRG